MRPCGRSLLTNEFKIHDLIIEGLGGVLKRLGYSSVESLKARTAKLSKKFHSSEIHQ
jgi:hypothetical protein